MSHEVKKLVGYSVFLIAVIVVILTFGKDKEGARKILEDNNYTNIQTTGYSFFGCNKEDFFKTGFKATTPNGKSVEGTVCKGLFSGSYIRLDY